MASNQKAAVIDPEHVGLHCEVNFERTLKQRVKELLKPQNDLFPGAQPVSFRSSNMDLLFQEDYYVCEKSDGVRYLLLSIHTKEGPSCFLINRNNVYQYVNSVMLPCRENLNTFQHESLIDGELVIDENKSNGQKAARFLAFDLMVYNTTVITQRSFATRLGLLQQEVINPLQLFLSSNPDIMRKQPFRIELKKMERSYGLNLVLSSIPNLKHPSDGLIFTPVELPYKSGICSKLLKWKPLEKLTIDFRIQVTYNNDRKPLYHLQTVNNGALKIFSFLQLSAELYSRWKLSPPDGKIAEFKWDPEWKVIIIEKGYAPQTEIGGWVFVKFRSDKTVPNDEQVVKETLESIKNGVSRKTLEHSIEKIRTQWKERERRATNQSLMHSKQNTLYDKSTISTKTPIKPQGSGSKNDAVINPVTVEENDKEEEPVANILDSVKKSPSPFDEDLGIITANNDDSAQENTVQDFSIIDQALLEYKNKLDLRNTKQENVKEEVTSQSTGKPFGNFDLNVPLRDNQRQNTFIDQLKQNDSTKNEIDLPFNDHGKRSASFPEIKDSIAATCSKRRLLSEANLDIVSNVPMSEKLESTSQDDKKVPEPLKIADLPPTSKFTEETKELLTSSCKNTFDGIKGTSGTIDDNVTSNFHHLEVRPQGMQEKANQINITEANAHETGKANIGRISTKFEINTVQKNNIELVEPSKKLAINSGDINNVNNSTIASNEDLVEHKNLKSLVKVREDGNSVENKINDDEVLSEKAENEPKQTISTFVAERIDIINEGKRPNFNTLKESSIVYTKEKDVRKIQNFNSNSQNVNREFVQSKPSKISNTPSNVFKLISIDEKSALQKEVGKNESILSSSFISGKGIDNDKVQSQDNIVQSSIVNDQPYVSQVAEPNERKLSYKPVDLSSMLIQPNKDSSDPKKQHSTNQSHSTVLPHSPFDNQITLNPPSNLIGSLNYGNKTSISNVVASSNPEYTHTTHVEIRPRPPEVPINKDFMQNTRKPSNPGVQLINRQAYKMPLIPPRALEPQLDNQPHQSFHTQSERPNYQKRGSQVAVIYPNIPPGMQPNPNIAHYAQQVIIPEGSSRRGSVAVRIYPIQRPIIGTNIPVDLNAQQNMIAAKQMQMQMLRRASHSQDAWIPNPNNPRQPNQHPFISQAASMVINRPQSPFETKSHIASPNPNFSEPVFQVQHQPQFRSPHLPEYHHQQNYTRHQEYRQTPLQQIPQSPDEDIRNQPAQVAPSNVPTKNTSESKPSSAPRQSKGMLDFIMNP